MTEEEIHLIANVCTKKIRTNPEIVKCIPENLITKEFALALVKYSVNTYKYLPNKLQKDKDVAAFANGNR